MRLPILSALLCSAALLSSPVFAEEGLGGNLGVGLSGSLTGNTGVHASYWVSDNLGAMATLSFYTFNPKDDALEPVTGFLLGGAVIVNLYKPGRLNLGAVVSVGFGAADAGYVRLGVGARPEFFVYDWLSVHTEFGFTGVFVNDQSRYAFEGSYVTLGKGGFFGGVGATFYLGRGSTPKQTTTVEDEEDDFDFDF